MVFLFKVRTMFDLIVIGGGSAGVRTARIAASLGAKVAIAEEKHWGGTCVNVGCVPKKLYHYLSGFKYQLKTAEAYGWGVDFTYPNWSDFQDKKNHEIHRLNRIYTDMLKNSGCTLLEGHAKIVSDSAIEIGGQRYDCKHMVIAVGAKPSLPPIEGIEHTLSSDDLFYTKALPEKLLVVGGGYIGCEFASIYCALDTQVTVATRSEILGGFDRESVDFLKQEMALKGISFKTGFTPVSIVKQEDGGLRVTFDCGTCEIYDAVLMATGRVPLFENLGIECLDLQINDQGLIDVDGNFETCCPGVFAIGDIIDYPDLTPAALAQGMYVAKYLFAEGEHDQPDLKHIATAIFTHPQMSCMGLSEECVNEQELDADVYVSRFKHLKYSVTKIDTYTYIKLICEPNNGKILGIQIVGDEVGEIMQGFSALMVAGVTKRQMDRTIGIHPTIAEELVTLREPTRCHRFNH